MKLHTPYEDENRFVSGNLNSAGSEQKHSQLEDKDDILE